jgi:hypothetical protein
VRLPDANASPVAAVSAGGVTLRSPISARVRWTRGASASPSAMPTGYMARADAMRATEYRAAEIGDVPDGVCAKSIGYYCAVRSVHVLASLQVLAEYSRVLNARGYSRVLVALAGIG